MYYSNILVISFLLLSLAGCSAAGPTTIDDSIDAREKVAHLVRQAGSIQSPRVNAYFSYLLDRLVRALPPGSAEVRHLEVVILQEVPQHAGTPGGGFILLSKPLIASLQTEAELAFVVAHELSHLVLGHRTSDAGNPKIQPELERAADSYALGLIAVAGYDPRVASNALLRAAPHGALTMSKADMSKAYPSLQERVQALQAQLEQSGWRPPGTIDRREFQLVRKEIMLG